MAIKQKYGHPTYHEGMYSYFILVKNYRAANATRFNIDPADLTDLNTLMGTVTTVDTYLYLFPLWADKKGSKTTAIRDKLVDLEKLIKAKLSYIYDNIPAKLWTSEDRNTLGCKTGAKAKPIHQYAPCGKQCLPTVDIKTGGMVKFLCKPDHDISRAGEPDKTFKVEIAWKLVAHPITEAGIKSRRIMLSGPDDGTTKESFSKTVFTKNFGPENAGIDMQYFIRWICIEHPVKNGS